MSRRVRRRRGLRERGGRSLGLICRLGGAQGKLLAQKMTGVLVAGAAGRGVCARRGRAWPARSSCRGGFPIDRRTLVSDLRVEQKQVLSREEVARFLSTLADGLADGGKVAVPLGNSSLELSVADQLRWELEVAVDGDGIELELELKWSTSGRASEESAGDEADNSEVN